MQYSFISPILFSVFLLTFLLKKVNFIEISSFLFAFSPVLLASSLLFVFFHLVKVVFTFNGWNEQKLPRPIDWTNFDECGTERLWWWPSSVNLGWIRLRQRFIKSVIGRLMELMIFTVERISGLFFQVLLEQFEFNCKQHKVYRK